MKLAEAIALSNSPSADPKPLWFVCGSHPLHWPVFLNAWGHKRFPGAGFHITTGLYGDALGNLERAATGEPSDVIVLIEWADLDPRLSPRSAAAWSLAVEEDIKASVAARLPRFRAALANVAPSRPVTLAPPALPLPPYFQTRPGHASRSELRLQALLATFLDDVAGIPGARVIDAAAYDAIAPIGQRLDVKMSLTADFPHSLAFASGLSQLLIDTAFPPAPAKGLITDLDDTLWRGIVGEVGPEAVAWTQAEHAAAHGAYQRQLAALAARGVLIGAASKNDPKVAEQALARPDLIVPRESIFPVAAGWGTKSESITRILEVWNIGPDSVVFVDDSEMELAEVQRRFPAIRCRRFPREDPNGVGALLQELRELFGKPSVSQEDQLRVASVRGSAEMRAQMDGAPDADFLEGLEGTVTFDLSRTNVDGRPLELINKTNQFNLNGRRYTTSEWGNLLQDPRSFLATVSYTDRFGPLGAIGVMAGTIEHGEAEIVAWVLSCRAFSRNIEHHMVAWLLQQGVGRVRLQHVPTERNGPLRDFLAAIGSDAQLVLPSMLDGAKLPHRVQVTGYARA